MTNTTTYNLDELVNEIHPTLLEFFNQLKINDNVDTYLVGGAVRDRILSNIGVYNEPKQKDYDFVLVGINEYIEEFSIALQSTFEKVAPAVGNDFPVWIVTIDNVKYDLALARTERSTGNGYNDFFVQTSNVTIEQDLLRRDLTINAMAVNVNDYSFTDPYNGLKDCMNCVLKHTSPAFKEDPLRVLRIARFAARYNFVTSNHTIDFCKKMDYSVLTPERIGKELKKLFTTDNQEIFNFFQELKEFNWLDKVFPFLDNNFNFSYEYFLEKGYTFEKRNLSNNMAQILFFMQISNEKERKNYYNSISFYEKNKTLSIKKINKIIDDIIQLKKYIEWSNVDCNNINLIRKQLCFLKKEGLTYKEITCIFEKNDILFSKEEFNQFIIEPIVTSKDLFDIGFVEGVRMGSWLKISLNNQYKGLFNVETKDTYLELIKDLP